MSDAQEAHERSNVRSVPIDSTVPWNHTGFFVVAGRTYELTATGSWRDKNYEADADGYDSPNLLMRVAELKRRVPRARWFALIGALDEDRATQFVIGTKATFTAVRSGELTCFANDWMSKYGNNKGAVLLTIRERSSTA